MNEVQCGNLHRKHMVSGNSDKNDYNKKGDVLDLTFTSLTKNLDLDGLTEQAIHDQNQEVLDDLEDDVNQIKEKGFEQDDNLKLYDS